MSMRAISVAAGAGAVIFFGITTGTLAQTDSPYSKSSSGLTLSVIKSNASQNQITLQFNLENKTKARIYVRNAILDEKAFLGSGPQLPIPQSLAGIESCSGSVSQCVLSDYGALDLNKYSYIEPGGAIAFSFKYIAAIPVQGTDTLSFSVALVARLTKPNADPTIADPPQQIRFNFNFMALNR
jgi:hypothetical protein